MVHIAEQIPENFPYTCFPRSALCCLTGIKLLKMSSPYLRENKRVFEMIFRLGTIFLHKSHNPILNISQNFVSYRQASPCITNYSVAYKKNACSYKARFSLFSTWSDIVDTIDSKVPAEKKESRQRNHPLPQKHRSCLRGNLSKTVESATSYHDNNNSNNDNNK